MGIPLPGLYSITPIPVGITGLSALNPTLAALVTTNPGALRLLLLLHVLLRRRRPAALPLPCVCVAHLAPHLSCVVAPLAVRCEPLDLAYIDGMLLLPLTIEHTIGAAALRSAACATNSACICLPLRGAGPP